MAKIAGAHESVDHFLRSAADIAAEGQPGLDEDAARLASGKELPIRAKDAQLGPRRRVANRARGSSQVVWRRDRSEADFGRAVQVVEPGAERLHEPRAEFAPERGPGREHGAQGREV